MDASSPRWECFECARIGFEKRMTLEGTSDKDKEEVRSSTNCILILIVRHQRHYGPYNI